MESPSYDYVIVGGGTAGLVLASRLSEDPEVQVLVIEAGKDQTADPRVTMPAMWPALLATDSVWNFCTTPQEAMGGRKIAVPQGRLLGGDSSINGAAFTSTSRANVDAWAKLGNPGWDWATFSKALSKSYTLPSESRSDAGGSGPLRLNVPGEPGDQWPGIWLDTIRNLGFPTSGDCLSGDFYGGIINPETIDPATKQRSSAATAYLQPARGRANLTVMTEATAERILLNRTDPDGVTAEGVEYYSKDSGKRERALARKDVILCAGVFNSPKLLELSGIGSAALLAKHGIDVIVDNPHVGENLQNHVMVGVNFVVGADAPPTIDALSRQEPDALAAAMAAYAQGGGPLATGGTFASAQLPFPGINTDSGRQDLDQLLSNPALQAPPAAAASTAAAPAFSRHHEDFVRSVLRSPTEPSGCYISFPGFAKFNPDGYLAPTPPGQQRYFSVALLLMHPLSRGSVHITSAEAASPDNLAFDPRYLSHPLDLEVAARHLLFLTGQLAATAPLAAHLHAAGAENKNPVPDLDAARDYVRDTAVGAHHFTSTCAMMPREAGGVVDHALRVHGVARGLRVCDASIIPITPRANTQAAVYGVAERAAEIIKSAM